MASSNRLKEAEKEKKVLTKTQIYDILREYLAEQINLASRKQRNEENFALPAWSEFQAYQLGGIKVLEKLLDFIPEPDKGK